MAGTLFHGLRLEKSAYKGNDGAMHYEIIPVDGGMEVISNSSWRELKEYCTSKGIPLDAWPDYEHPFDKPIEEIAKRSDEIRRLMAASLDDERPQLYWLEKLVAYLERGEMFFYSQS